MDGTLAAKGRDQDHRFFPLTIRRSTWEPKGALDCVMFCIIASPPLTVLSVTMDLTPASASNKTPSITSSMTDRSPLTPVARSKGHEQDDQAAETKPPAGSCSRILDQSLGSTRAC